MIYERSHTIDVWMMLKQNYVQTNLCMSRIQWRCLFSQEHKGCLLQEMKQIMALLLFFSFFFLFLDLHQTYILYISALIKEPLLARRDSKRASTVASFPSVACRNMYVEQLVDSPGWSEPGICHPQIEGSYAALVDTDHEPHRIWMTFWLHR
jgi:hypothetical protein